MVRGLVIVSQVESIKKEQIMFYGVMLVFVRLV
jgi:hypothetical protein